MYRIKTSGGYYHILEISTQRLIFKSINEQRIKDLCKKLNAGSGFNGHTPAFFCL